MTDNITLGVVDEFRDSLFGHSVVEIPENREDYIFNSFRPAIQYEYREKLTLELVGKYNFKDYDLNPILYTEGISGYDDWEELGIDLNSAVEMNTKTDLIFEGSLTQRYHDDQCDNCNSDVFIVGLRAGVAQRFSGGKTLRGWLIYENRDYDEESPELDKTNYDNLGGYIEFENILSGVSRYTVSVFSQFSSSERISTAYYRNTGAEAEYAFKFAKRMEAAIGAHYSKLEYENISDPWEDDYYKASATIGYEMVDWASLRLRYQYAKRESEIDRYDFDHNMVSIYLHLNYDFYR